MFRSAKHLISGNTLVAPAGGGGPVERYTPAEYIEKARLVLGDIDLDPASSEQAQKTVEAKKWALTGQLPGPSTLNIVRYALDAG